MQKGKLIVVSGPSGVGKGTVLKALMQQHDRLRYSVSATTRPIRPGEVDGVNYYFISREEFEQMIAQDRLLEYARYVDNYYGTPEAPLNAMLEDGYDVLAEVEVQGALQIKKRRPDAILIFIIAPSFGDIASRLRGRGDTPEEVVVKRLETARWEYSQAINYDYIVLNDTVESAVREILAVLTAENCKAANRAKIMKEAE